MNHVACWLLLGCCWLRVTVAEEHAAAFPSADELRTEATPFLEAVPTLDTSDPRIDSYWLRALLPTVGGSPVEAIIGWERSAGSSVVLLSPDTRIPLFWASCGELMIYDATQSELLLVDGTHPHVKVFADQLRVNFHVLMQSDDAPHDIQLASIVKPLADDFTITVEADVAEIRGPSPSGKSLIVARFRSVAPTELMSIECVARRDISVTMLAIRELHINTPLPAELRLSPRAELLASGLPIRHIEIASDSDVRFLMKSTMSCQVARIALSDPPLRTMEHTRLFWTDVDWRSAAARDATFSNKLTAVYEKLNSE